jgi:ribose transport system substrate-binding protein
MNVSLRHLRIGLVCSLLCVAALAVAGCGDDDGDSGGKTKASTSDVPADVKASIAEATKGTWAAPPTSAPKPPAGANVWIISCGQQVASCNTPSAAVKEAAQAIGWKPTIADGKFTPTGFSAAIRQAIAAKADGIVLVSIDCPAAKQAIRDAKGAGIKVAALYSMDCDDRFVGGTPEFDAGVKIQGSQSYGEVVERWAAVKADNVIDVTDGKAKVINFKQNEFLTVRHIQEGFEQRLKTCSTCEIVETISITAADFGPKLSAKVQSALLKHPEANVLEVPYDGAILAGVGTGVRAAQRAGKIYVQGAEALPPNVELIRKQTGEESSAVGFPAVWLGWAAIDTMNSLLAGEEPQESGIGWQIIDVDRNMPPEGSTWEPDVDYKAAYKKAWGR